MKSHFLILAVGLGVAGGCGQLTDLLNSREMACTTIGCSNSFNVTVKPKAGEFPAGIHEVIITAEGSPTRTCTFKFPIEGSIESGRCTDGGGVRLLVTPMQDCRTMTQGDFVSQTCTPLPGKFQEHLSVPGLPAKVRITQTLAGGPTYLEREATPGYQDVYPNGRECGAVCKQAGADWDF
jgi:hypothetical protein